MMTMLYSHKAGKAYRPYAEFIVQDEDNAQEVLNGILREDVALTGLKVIFKRDIALVKTWDGYRVIIKHDDVTWQEIGYVEEIG